MSSKKPYARSNTTRPRTLRARSRRPLSSAPPPAARLIGGASCVPRQWARGRSRSESRPATRSSPRGWHGKTARRAPTGRDLLASASPDWEAPKCRRSAYGASGCGGPARGCPRRTATRERRRVREPPRSWPAAARAVVLYRGGRRVGALNRLCHGALRASLGFARPRVIPGGGRTIGAWPARRIIRIG